ncbi:hypothetical protein C0J52_26661 [Blattella germanica]|nr:hypothetical protein C0J52_26661 [Blattella germanica]
MHGRYSFREQADIIFMYGRANGNGREAVRLYQLAFPDRRQPNHQTFVAVYRRVAETGTVAPQTGDRRVVRTPDLEEDILHCVEEDPLKTSGAFNTFSTVDYILCKTGTQKLLRRKRLITEADSFIRSETLDPLYKFDQPSGAAGQVK